MNDILVIFDKHRKSQETNLMMQQAIVAVTRSILANRNTDQHGMTMSHHRIIVPINLDILPLFASVANDFTEFVEPEPEKEIQHAPFLTYWDDYYEDEKNLTLIRQFLNPRWFQQSGERLTLREILRNYNPKTAIVVGGSYEVVDLLRNQDIHFDHLIAYNQLMDQELHSSLKRLAQHVTMADDNFEDAIRRSMRNLGMPNTTFENLGYWSNMYGKEEKRPDLEPFIAFGAAFEMAMFIRDSNR